MKEHKVLILEDSISDQLTLEIILEEFPTIKPIFAQNTQEFLYHLALNEIELVIVDIVLKESLNGIEIANQISDKSTWLIICSAHACQKYYEQFKELSFTKFYIQKPIDEYVLRTHLDSFIFSKKQFLSVL